MEGAQKQPARHSFVERFLAWWEGYELEDLVQQNRAQTTQSRARAVPLKKSRFSPRVECLNQVWGEGFAAPGDAEFCTNLVAPVGLFEQYKVLALEAGLGGPARTIAKVFGCCVDAMDGDKELAEAGMALSETAGIGRRVPVTVYDSATTELSERTHDCVFGRELLHKLEDKRDLVRRIEVTLNYGGHFLFTDYVVGEGRLDGAGFKEWLQSEPNDLFMASVQEISNLIVESGLQPRVVQNISDVYLEQITAAWSRWQKIVDSINTFSNKEEILRHLVDEVTLWTKRAAAINNGDIQVYSFYATKRKAAQALSDW